MRNEQQNPGTNPKQQTQGSKQAQERGTTKQGVHAQDKEKKGKSSPLRDDDRKPGRTH